MRIVRISLLSAIPMFAVTGCITLSPRPVYVAPGPDGAVGEVVTVEPAPAYRVYMYDPGFPPGVYSYNGYYYYQGRRFERGVFMNHFVEPNRRAGRYANAEENRHRADEIERQRGVRGGIDSGHNVHGNPPSTVRHGPLDAHQGPKTGAKKPPQAGGRNVPEKKPEPEK